MSAENVKDKKLAFGRLLHDLHQDSLHSEVEEEREHLPKMSQSATLTELRAKLKKRYRRSRISPTLMYMPRVALTAAILLSCAVALIYLERLRDAEQRENLRNKQQLHEIDSLFQNTNRKDSFKKDEKRY